MLGLQRMRKSYPCSSFLQDRECPARSLCFPEGGNIPGCFRKRKLSGVFGIGRSEDQGVLWSFFLNEEEISSLEPFPGRIKSAGILQYSEIVLRRVVILVRIGGKNVNMCGNGGTGFGREPQWINIGAEFDNVFFF